MIQCNDLQQYFIEIKTCVLFAEESVQKRNYNDLEHSHCFLQQHIEMLSKILNHLLQNQVRQ